MHFLLLEAKFSKYNMTTISAKERGYISISCNIQCYNSKLQLALSATLCNQACQYYVAFKK